MSSAVLAWTLEEHSLNYELSSDHPSREQFITVQLSGDALMLVWHGHEIWFDVASFCVIALCSSFKICTGSEIKIYLKRLREFWHVIFGYLIATMLGIINSYSISLPRPRGRTLL
jgi:hypothetical protein